MIPFVCAASSASAIWRLRGNASLIGIGPAATRSANVGPSTNSRTSAIGFLDSVDRGDMGMIQGGQHTRLAFESQQPFGIERKGSGENLDGYIPAKFGVPRAVDLTHTASAD